MGSVSAADCPQSAQNFAVAESSLPQLEQAREMARPHCSQNFAPMRFSLWQRTHFMWRGNCPKEAVNSTA
jgi:hypothetical protein